jgi:hypothetical protein
MTKIFISYRRKDSQAEARRLYDQLIKVYKPDEIFFDHLTITPGADFEQAIEAALAKCNVMIAIINKGWLKAADEAGRRRIDQPNDFVRREILHALENHITLIPVLIGETEMPKEADLPKELQRLSKRQANPLRESQFNADVKRLIAAIKKYVPASARERFQDFSQEIAEEYNDWFGLTQTDEGRRLKMYYTSETAMSTIGTSHLRTEALEWLIEEADLGFWMKHNDEVQPDEFWTRILRAVVASMKADHPFGDDPTLSDADWIREHLPFLEHPDKQDEV